MKSSDIINLITRKVQGSDLIVLKGFPVNILLNMGNNYILLDKEIYVDGKIDPRKIHFQSLFSLLISANTPAIISYESFISLTDNLKMISVLNKNICIVSNNLLAKMENPTTEDIPDFGSSDFTDTFTTECYAPYYSNCEHINGKQYVQYVKADYQSSSLIREVDIVDSLHVDFDYVDSWGACGGKIQSLSVEDGSLDTLLSSIFYDDIELDSVYSIDYSECKSRKWGVLLHVAQILGKQLHFLVYRDKEKVCARPELSEMLQEIWGYPSFRTLQVYKDLYQNHDLIEISQGEIIETVIRQCEYAYRNENGKMRNILLTSPTGAGKSLLFQLSAVYIAEKYKLLTIVVSPLLALMDDQVNSLSGNYKAVATLNSNKSANEKERILNGVKNGEINLLYLSPELLLSYSITTFIGERKIGLVVVDEAHTVTTWGRDFRVDYWFLGGYLNKIKRLNGQRFPIFALTATAVWDISGKNDMVFDTIRSLNMSPCLKYIGKIKRDNIVFDINQVNISKKYDETRLNLTISRIREFIQENKKTIVYFPYKGTIFKMEKTDSFAELADKVTEFHSWLSPAQKKVNAESFKTGEKPVMCATKAFGMGVDVSDIEIVYHHAPSGGLPDYIQEIGRLARDPHILGTAKLDFSIKDYKYRNTLYWLSSTKLYQLKAVLKKLLALYRMNGEKRNMLISASDFEYIFPKLNSSADFDKSLKSCLMLISNDLHNKLGFNALIVRPKSLFSQSYLQVDEKQSDTFYRNYSQYLSHIDKKRRNVFLLKADKLWNEKYNQYSFPDFKRRLADGLIFNKFQTEIICKLDIHCQLSVAQTRENLCNFFSNSTKCLNYMSTSHHRISFKTLDELLYSELKNEEEKETFWESFKLVYASKHALGSVETTYCTLKGHDDEIQFENYGYEQIESQYLNCFDKFIQEKMSVLYCSPKANVMKLCELLSCLNIADCQKIGGDNPVIFIRINNPFYLWGLVKNNNYENAILDDIQQKFDLSERIFTYFFSTPMNNEQRWNFIESYFLGMPEEELLKIH